ncbi:MAG: hypothetical protein IPI64_15145 [Chloracidobacterium sp.]|nr:hypothetical protein [Chloracidobacterium sp.]
MEKVKPTLLEPIMDVEVFTPQEVSGDIMGDLNSRRGRVGGMEVRGKQQVIKAKVPLAEMLGLPVKTKQRHPGPRLVSHAVFALRPAARQPACHVVDEAVAAGRESTRRRRLVVLFFMITNNASEDRPRWRFLFF